jgi:hypothetical protein
MPTFRLWQNTTKVFARLRLLGVRLVFDDRIMSVVYTFKLNGLANAQMFVGRNFSAHAGPFFNSATVRACSRVIETADIPVLAIGCIY